MKYTFFVTFLSALVLGASNVGFAEEQGLQDALDAKAAESKAPAELKAQMERHIDEVIKTGIYEKALKVGDEAPEFTLKNHLGEQQTLAQHLKDGPVILTWYRGGW